VEKTRTRRKPPFVIGYVGAGLIAVVVVGFLAYQGQCFYFPEPMLSVLLLGLMGALIYVSVRIRKAGFAVLIMAASFLARVALTPRSYSVAAAAVYTLIIGCALVAAAYVQQSLTGIGFGRFISMALILGTGYALMTLLFINMGSTQAGSGTVWSQTLLGAGMGAAMGLGFELVDHIGPRRKS
jgi:hypothetical protein